MTSFYVLPSLGGLMAPQPILLQKLKVAFSDIMEVLRIPVIVILESHILKLGRFLEMNIRPFRKIQLSTVIVFSLREKIS